MSGYSAGAWVPAAPRSAFPDGSRLEFGGRETDGRPALEGRVPAPFAFPGCEAHAVGALVVRAFYLEARRHACASGVQAARV